MIVGFAGSGSIAAAMARGWAAGDGGPERLLFTDSGSGRAAKLAEEVGGEPLGSNAELAEQSDLLVLAMKPGALDAVAAETQGSKAVLSLLGPTPVSDVAKAFPSAAAMRAIPNVAVEQGRGVLCFVAADGTPPDLVAEVKGLLEPLGWVVELDDKLFDAATALMGCSPAWLALAIQALADAGVAEGLDSQLAHSLVVETTAGTAVLLRDRHPAELRRAVASPGGSTEAGLAVLDQEGVVEAFAGAVRASLERERTG